MKRSDLLRIICEISIIFLLIWLFRKCSILQKELRDTKACRPIQNFEFESIRHEIGELIDFKKHSTNEIETIKANIFELNKVPRVRFSKTSSAKIDDQDFVVDTFADEEAVFNVVPSISPGCLMNQQSND
jgi:hypothetical protein